MSNDSAYKPPAEQSPRCAEELAAQTLRAEALERQNRHLAGIHETTLTLTAWVAATQNSLFDELAATGAGLALEIIPAPPASQPESYLFGRFAVAVIVNKSNPLKQITLEQFAKVYSGEFTKWIQVEPALLAGQEIKAYCQPRDSNTNYIVERRVLNG